MSTTPNPIIPILPGLRFSFSAMAWEAGATVAAMGAGVVADISLLFPFQMEPDFGNSCWRVREGYMEDLLRVNECSAAGRSHCVVWASGDSPGTRTARLLSIFLADFAMRGCAISFLTLARVASPAFFVVFFAFLRSIPPS